MRPTLASWPVVAARTPPPSSRTTSRYPSPVSILIWEMCFFPLSRATRSERYTSAASIAPARSLSTPASWEEERRSRSPERTAHDSMSSESALRSASTRSRSCAVPAPLRSAISISRPLFAAEGGIISEGHHSLRKSLTEAPGNGIFTAPGAISSAGERCLHTAEVAGSNPASPTRKKTAFADKTRAASRLYKLFDSSSTPVVHQYGLTRRWRGSPVYHLPGVRINTTRLPTL